MTLEHFDTLLAFVVILAGVSLLVTILVQMTSALFGLRGSNLRWGLKTLLARVGGVDLPMHAKCSEDVTGAGVMPAYPMGLGRCNGLRSLR
jgi:hypothetical protein